jgi:DNA-binding transcriptional MerR regulator
MGSHPWLRARARGTRPRSARPSSGRGGVESIELDVSDAQSLTGVSVRTLHHYDAIGLLHPSKRLESGRRLYSSADLLKLQQILTLRYLGFQLRQVRELLERTDFDVLASLRIQRKASGARRARSTPPARPC